jgi:CCR4-NOT transcription complex subunit 6
MVVRGSYANNSQQQSQSETTNSGAQNREQPEKVASDYAQKWTALDIGGMGVKNLSPALFQYTFLTTLYLNHNNLLFLPPEIMRLSSLTVLNVSSNKLTSLPPEIGMLVNLVDLLVFDNSLSTLPMELGNLYQLQNLGLEGNPISEPLLTLLQKEGTNSLIAFLRDNCPGNCLKKIVYTFL